MNKRYFYIFNKNLFLNFTNMTEKKNITLPDNKAMLN